MSEMHALQTALELLFSALLIYGFMNEKKIIRWEQRTKRKIKRFIYNLIVKYEKGAGK